MPVKNNAGLAVMDSLNMSGFLEIGSGGDGLLISGKGGVGKILTPLDKKADFIVFEDKIPYFIPNVMV